MKAAGGGIAQLAPLFSASLLLHLVILFAVIGLWDRKQNDHHAVPAMEVEQVVADDSAIAPPTSRPAPSAISAQKQEKKPADPRARQPVAAQALPAGASGPASTPVTGPTPLPLPGTGEVPLLIAGTGGTAPREGAASRGSAGVASQRDGGGPAGAAGHGVTPSAGGGAASPPRRGAYQALLKRLIEAHKEYPLAARRTGEEGSCLRRFVIGRSGSLKKVEALSSCGHVFLDEAATRAITTVGTFPPLPDEFTGVEAAFTVTIRFSLPKD